MCPQYAINLSAYLFFLRRLACNPKAQRHDLHSNYANLSIHIIHFILQIQLGQEIYIWVESNADTVNK